MPIEYVGGRGAARTGTTSSISIAIDSGLTGGIGTGVREGDLVVVTVSTGTAGRAPALDITTPTGFTALTAQRTTATTYDTNVQVSYKLMGSTPDTAITIPATGNTADGQSYTIQVFRGVDQTTPLDADPTYATGSGTSNRPDPAAITPVTAGAWIVICTGGATQLGTAALTASYLTNLLFFNASDTNDGNVGSGYYTGWTSGAYDPAEFTDGTVAGTASWGATTIALRPTFSQITATTGSPTITEGVTFNGEYGQTFQWGTGGGTFTPVAGATAYYLVVAGGGGGSGAFFGFAGGAGGGGGVVGGLTTSTFLTTASSYTVAVGTGGTGGAAPDTRGTNGGNSSITGTNAPAAAVGGGGGGAMDSPNQAGASGGSGGGGGNAAAGGSGTVGQGNAGAAAPDAINSGGGGGASAAASGKDGGNGLTSAITGASVTYGGGGAGGGNSTAGTPGTGGGGTGGTFASPTPGNGTDGLGGGGGGVADNSGTFVSGGDGGDGTVIIFVPYGTGGGGGGASLKFWDGSAFVVKPVKGWTGSAWVTAKMWDGSAWV